MHRKPLFTILAVLAILVLPALCCAQNGGETNFGMIGITNVQILLINLNADSTGICAAKLGFQNSEGAAVGPTSNVTLAAGQSTSLELKGTVLTKVPKQRVEVLPVVTPSTNYPPVPCHASVEIIEGTPAATIAEAAVSYPPQPIFGAVGITEFPSICGSTWWRFRRYPASVSSALRMKTVSQLAVPSTSISAPVRLPFWTCREPRLPTKVER